MRNLTQIILEKEQTKKQKAYQDFFNKKLEDFGAKSPAELSEDDKKKFFDEVKKEWKGGDVSESAKIEQDKGADVKGGLKDSDEGEGTIITLAKGDGEKSSDDIENAKLKLAKPKTGGDGSEMLGEDKIDEASNKFKVYDKGIDDITIVKDGEIYIISQKDNSISITKGALDQLTGLIK